MKKNINISIGIPAYNESANIKKLLLSLLAQEEKSFKIIEIIVISDGSIDKTVSQVRSINNKKIKLLTDNNRQGKSARLSQIFKIFKGDVLFLIDGDIKIFDKLLISKIIDSADIEKAGLIGINALSDKPVSQFQRAMGMGTVITKEIGKRWKNGRNYLLFKGCFLGLSRKLAKSVKMPPEVVNNDSYLYFAAIEKGLSPVFVENAIVYFISPKSYSDYLKQSWRFKGSKSEMQRYFSSDLSSEYLIPPMVYFKVMLISFLSNPVYLTSYLLINIFSRNEKQNGINNKWSIAVSTKNE